jgi:hypothetical protein
LTTLAQHGHGAAVLAQYTHLLASLSAPQSVADGNEHRTQTLLLLGALLPVAADSVVDALAEVEQAAAEQPEGGAAAAEPQDVFDEENRAGAAARQEDAAAALAAATAAWAIVEGGVVHVTANPVGVASYFSSCKATERLALVGVAAQSLDHMARVAAALEAAGTASTQPDSLADDVVAAWLALPRPLQLMLAAPDHEERPGHAALARDWGVLTGPACLATPVPLSGGAEAWASLPITAVLAEKLADAFPTDDSRPLDQALPADDVRDHCVALIFQLIARRAAPLCGEAEMTAWWDVMQLIAPTLDALMRAAPGEAADDVLRTRATAISYKFYADLSGAPNAAQTAGATLAQLCSGAPAEAAEGEDVTLVDRNRITAWWESVVMHR